MMSDVALSTPMTSDHKPLSVLQIGAGWFPEYCGGAQKVFYELSRKLPAEGVDLRGLVVGSDAVAIDSQGAVNAFTSRSASLLARLWAARAAVRKAFEAAVPDIVAVHFALFAAPALDLIDRRRLVVHFHGPWAAERQVEGAHPLVVRGMKAIESAVYQRASSVIVLSRDFGDIVCKDYGVPAQRVHVVPGGVDCTQFAISESQAEARRSLGWPENGRIVLAVRRLARRMGLDELISAMVEVRRAEPDVHLFIAGDGEEALALRKKIEQLGLENTVTLLGLMRFDLLPMAYRAADLTIVPSRGLEGFGLITVESLATGTPVLVTPVGGMPETVAPLSTNLVLDGITASDLSAGLITALNGERSLPDAEACRRYVLRHFDWSAIAALTEQTYRDALG